MRYNNSEIITINDAGPYSKILSKRKIKNAILLSTPVHGGPHDLDFSIVTESQEMWSVGTKLWKLASKHYGDGGLYWVIGLYNMKPTDAHWKIGDPVYIPHPHEYVADMLRGE